MKITFKDFLIFIIDNAVSDKFFVNFVQLVRRTRTYAAEKKIRTANEYLGNYLLLHLTNCRVNFDKNYSGYKSQLERMKTAAKTLAERSLSTNPKNITSFFFLSLSTTYVAL